MEDTQLPDAPETPAPLFAYRALKGFIFGSPDDRDDQNKENKAEPKLGRQSPEKPTISSSLTPQKRKRSSDYLSSPMKSILRPSGAATPRALHLQKGNITVTFKDIRKSVSPQRRTESANQEGRRRDSTRAGTLEQAVTTIPAEKKVLNTRAAKIPSPKVAKLQPSVSSRVAAEVQNTALSPEPGVSGGSTTSATFDFEAYKLTTEKEMKKLMRYGQKMREYARKQDEENAKLRLALEQLRRENERLRSAEEVRVNAAAVAKPVAQQSAAADSQRLAKVARGDGLAGAVERQRNGAGASCSKTETKISFDIARQSRAQGETEEAQARNQDLAAKSTSLEGPLQDKERQSSARLPPDRLAAARERIRLKAARRRAPDVSQVEWAGL